MTPQIHPPPIPVDGPPRLTRGMRFIWICILGGGVMIMHKALTLGWRHERLIEDTLLDKNKQPAVVKLNFEAQRWMENHSLHILLFLILVVIWICFSKRPKAVLMVVLTLTGALAIPGLACITISASSMARMGYDFWKEVQELSPPAESSSSF